MTLSTTADVAHVAHHFDDAEQQYTAAELGMWVFLATEVLFFGGLFCGYAVYRYSYPAAFAQASHLLDVRLGTINTAVLLTSSLTMALTVHSAQTSRRWAAVTFLICTILLGTVFLGIKGYEYHHKFEQHLVPGPMFVVPSEVQTAGHANSQHLGRSDDGKDNQQVELFFSFYFAMTGLHAAHMIIGVAILFVLAIAAARGAFSAAYFTPVEMTGLYWHFVDIVWVFLFPLLYLIR